MTSYILFRLDPTLAPGWRRLGDRRRAARWTAR